MTLIVQAPPPLVRMPYAAVGGGGGGGGGSGWSTADLYYTDFSTASGTTPPAGMTLTVSSGSITFPSDATAYIGTHYMDCSFPSSGSDGGGRGDVTFAERTNVWVGIAWRGVVLPSTGIKDQKTLIFRDDLGGGHGDAFSAQWNQQSDNWIANFLTGGATTHYLGSTYHNTGVWQLFKLHLNNNASGQRTWTGYVNRSSSAWFSLTESTGVGLRMSDISFGGTLNGGSGASHFQFGAIAIATTDPGWP